MVDVQLVGARLAAEFAVIKHRIRGISSEVAPRLALMDKTAEIASYVRKEIDLVLIELSEAEDIVDQTLEETRDDR